MADLILPASLSTELDAVNVMLSAIGDGPYATLSPSPSVDVDQCLQHLNAAFRMVQSKGWNWNREYAYPVALDTNGNAYLPANTLRVMRSYFNPTDAGIGSVPVPIVARGNQLYDQLHHTYIFTQSLVCDLILLLEWSLIPESARRVITLEATKTYTASDSQSSPVLQVTAADLRMAWATLEQEEDETAKWNAVSGNLDVFLKLMGEGSMRRTRSGYSQGYR